MAFGDVVVASSGFTALAGILVSSLLGSMELWLLGIRPGGGRGSSGAGTSRFWQNLKRP